MGSATTHALSASAAALSAQKKVTIDTAAELFSAARAIGETSALSGALADSAAPADSRAGVVAAVFSAASAPTKAVLSTAVSQRWSSAADLVDGVEELAIRAAAIAGAKEDIEGELFGFTRVIAENPELELALGSRLGENAAKGDLVRTLLAGTTSEATTLIVSSLVSQPRGRRVRQLLRRAARIVSAQHERVVATVHTAQALSAEQRTRLQNWLQDRYGSAVSLNEVIDPAIVGGVRIQVADDVIDGSISARLAELRQKLAG